MIKYVNVYFDTIENQVLTEISLRKDLKNHTLKYSSGGASYELVFDDDTYSSRNYASPEFTIKFWILFIISLVIIIVLTFVGLFLSSGPGVAIFMAVFWPVAGFCVMGFIGFFSSSRGSSVSCSTSSYSGTYVSDDYSYSSDDLNSYDNCDNDTHDDSVNESSQIEDYHRIYSNSWSLIGFYRNGFVLDASHNVVGEYRNGFVDFHGSLYGQYDSLGILYISGQRVGNCENGTIYDEYGHMVGKYDGDTEGACAAALLMIF